MPQVHQPRPNVTPVADKAGLQAQVDEQVQTLYSSTASIEEKEVAALNYRKLVLYYSTLFNEAPAVNK